LNEAVDHERTYYTLFRQLSLKQQIWPENAPSGEVITGYENLMNWVFELSEDEESNLVSDSAGFDSDVLRVYLRGFKMTIFDNNWDHRKRKTPAEYFVLPADAMCAIRVLIPWVIPFRPWLDDSKRNIVELIIDVGEGIRDPRNDPESYRLGDLATTYLNSLPAHQRASFSPVLLWCKAGLSAKLLGP
jgi:hypothetical protein